MTQRTLTDSEALWTLVAQIALWAFWLIFGARGFVWIINTIANGVTAHG